MNLPSAKTKGIFYNWEKFLNWIFKFTNLKIRSEDGKTYDQQRKFHFLTIDVSRWKLTKFIFTWKRFWPPNFPFSWIWTELPTLSGFHACIQISSIKINKLYFTILIYRMNEILPSQAPWSKWQLNVFFGGVIALRVQMENFLLIKG